MPDAVGVESIDPSDLNLATIGIGQLAGSQTVTRTVTNVGAAGTYTVIGRRACRASMSSCRRRRSPSPRVRLRRTRSPSRRLHGRTSISGRSGR